MGAQAPLNPSPGYGLDQSPATPRALLSRRNFIRLLATGSLGVAFMGWRMTAAADDLEVTTRSLRVPGIPAGRRLRILHLSDLHHCGPASLQRIARAVELGLAQGPDVAALTGDFITGGDFITPGYGRTLGVLAAAVPTFACYGNHDGWRGEAKFANLEALLREAGVQPLENESAFVQAACGRVRIDGMGDLWKGVCDPTRLPPDDPSRPCVARIVLAHNPDSTGELRHLPFDLLLCGHTHGGQVRVPLLDYAPHIPAKDRRFIEGLVAWEGRHVHTTRGVGNLHGIRLSCPPEVGIVDLLGAGR